VKAAAAAPSSPGSPSRFGHGDLQASLVLIFPLLLAYEIGVLFAGHVNGADVVTRALYGALGRTPYLLLHVIIALAFLLWIRRANRTSTLSLDVVAPVALESALYALTLGAIIGVILDKLLGLGLGIGSIVDALGAGVHEELVFRLGVLGGLYALLSRSVRPRLAFVVALVASAILFSAAHHVGVHGEAFTQHAFAYRCLAGLAFGLIAWYRSLAHAVYAHAMYDMLVYWRS
jgi:hypothetical protein